MVRRSSIESNVGRCPFIVARRAVTAGLSHDTTAHSEQEHPTHSIPRAVDISGNRMERANRLHACQRRELAGEGVEHVAGLGFEITAIDARRFSGTVTTSMLVAVS